jgi:hypothetical protein
MEKLGFREGRVVEAIVTTFNKDGTPNAAPIGVRREGDRLAVGVHQGSDTARNILREGVFCVNLVLDPYLFLKTALSGHGGEGQELPGDHYGVCDSIPSPCLKDAEAVIEVRVADRKELIRRDSLGRTKFHRFHGDIVRVNIIDPVPKGYNRALGAAIELAIELSRGNKKNINKYIKIMEKTLEQHELHKIKQFLETIE